MGTVAGSEPQQQQIVHKILHPDQFKDNIMYHNSYNAAANFSTTNNGSGGLFNYLWKNTFTDQQQQQQQQKNTSSWKSNNNNNSNVKKSSSGNNNDSGRKWG